MRSFIQPGATIGVLGGGQLGRMFCLEARRAGYRTLVWTDEPPGSPAGQVADLEMNAPYDDATAFGCFIGQVSVATVEFENLPADLLAKIARQKPLRPGPLAIGICQNREREKTFLREQGLPCAPFSIVTSVEEMERALVDIGRPAVLKTCAFGYDGKGQVKIDTKTVIADAWRELGADRAILESWAPFLREISVVAARSVTGAFEAFPLCENEHHRHILDVTIVPARISPRVSSRARELAKTVAEALDYVGTLAVEMFLLEGDTVWINEIAPRPHNSGHFSLDACMPSQFGQQLRTVVGMEPAPIRMTCGAAVMVNLLGDTWPSEDASPDWRPLMMEPSASLHLYGKTVAKLRRKMGHFTICGDSSQQCLHSARAIKSALDEQGRWEAPASRA